MFFYLATAGVNHHVLLWNPYVISKPVGVSMKKKTLFFLPFNLSCFFFFLFLHLFHLSSSHHSPPFLLSLVILFFVFFFSSFSSFSSFTSLSSSFSFSSFSFSFSFLLLQLCLFFKVLRGHMQSVISVNFIQSRGQTISLSKDKVSMSWTVEQHVIFERSVHSFYTPFKKKNIICPPCFIMKRNTQVSQSETACYKSLCCNVSYFLQVLRIWDTHLQVCLQRLSGVFPKGPEVSTVLYFDEERSTLLTAFNNRVSNQVKSWKIRELEIYDAVSFKTLRNSSHLSTSSHRPEDVKMLRVALFTERGRCWEYCWDYKLWLTVD